MQEIQFKLTLPRFHLPEVDGREVEVERFLENNLDLFLFFFPMYFRPAYGGILAPSGALYDIS
ncbi:MAG: hypothetical protein DRP64_08905 [Verrucomicrobia bacterium]|nr:MAG: hypothetical protein DRP64_08905 [Verrucomicrobiota bacterium]